MRGREELVADVAWVAKTTLYTIEDPIEKWEAFNEAIKLLGTDYDVSPYEMDTIFKDAIYDYVNNT